MKVANSLTFSFILLILSVFLNSCVGERKEDDGNKVVFRYNESSGITSLDPAFSRSLENITAVSHLFNGLVQMDEKLNIIPCIAKNWEISEDGKVYTFFLDREVYFHPHPAFEGGKARKVTAMDFVYSFERLIDPKTASPGAWIFANIDNGFEKHLGFEAIEKYTLRIYLKEAFQPFLGLLTMKYCTVIPHEVVEESGDDFRKEPIGTGPFKFGMWKEGSKLVLLRNESYFEKDSSGKALPYLDAVSISFISDQEVEYLEFLKGNIDFITGNDGSNREFFKHDGKLKDNYKGRFLYRKENFLNTEYLGILMDSTLPSMKHNPLNHILIRKALNIAFDRRAMIKYLKNGIGEPAEEGFIPKGLPPFEKDWVKGYTFNQDSARKLLIQAGYPGGEGLGQLTLFTTSQYLTLCEFIQGQWGEIGIKTKIELNPAATNNELVALSRAPFFRKSWVADYPDAENYMALFYSGNFAPNGPNYTHFSNKEFDRLYEQSKFELNDSVRYGYYKRMEEIILNESPVIPLFYDQSILYYGTNIEGLKSNPMRFLDLRTVTKLIQN